MSQRRENVKASTLTAASALERRRQQATSLSKQRRGAALSAKRLRYNGSEDAADQMLRFSSPSAGADAVAAAVAALQEARGKAMEQRVGCLRAVRRLLGAGENAPLGAAVQTGVVPLLVRELQDASTSAGGSEAAMEAAWALTNLAAGEYPVAKEVMPAAPLLVMQVSAAQAEPQAEQCAWALGNLAADSHEFREQLVAQGAVVPLARMLLQAVPSAARDKAATVAAWALSNLVRGAGSPELAQLLGLEGCPAGLVSLLGAERSEELATEVAWVTAFATAGAQGFLHTLVNAGLFGPLLHRLMGAVHKVRDSDAMGARVALTPLLRTMGNLAAGGGSTVAAELLSNAGPLLQALTETLGCSHRGLQKEAAWVLASIAAIPGEDGAAAILESGAVPRMVQMMGEAAFDVRKEVGLALANTCAGGGGGSGSPQLLGQVLSGGGSAVLAAFLQMVRSQDADACRLGIQFTEMVLRCVPEGARMVEAADGIDALEEAQFRGAPELQAWAGALVDKYYGEDYGLEDSQ
eukprot:jgi/Tetstr1/453093/TSEL_003933.t1